MPCYSDGQVWQAIKAADAARASLDKLFDLIEHFFERLEVYTRILLSTGLTNIIVVIMVEVLSVLGPATKEIQWWKEGEWIHDVRPSFMIHLISAARNLMGIDNTADAALGRLERLMQKEVVMRDLQTLESMDKISRGA